MLFEISFKFPKLAKSNFGLLSFIIKKEKLTFKYFNDDFSKVFLRQRSELKWQRNLFLGTLKVLLYLIKIVMIATSSCFMVEATLSDHSWF